MDTLFPLPNTPADALTMARRELERCDTEMQREITTRLESSHAAALKEGK